MTEAHRSLAIKADLALLAELEGLKRENISANALKEEVSEHLIVDLREQNIKSQTSPNSPNPQISSLIELYSPK